MEEITFEKYTPRLSQLCERFLNLPAVPATQHNELSKILANH